MVSREVDKISIEGAEERNIVILRVLCTTRAYVVLSYMNEHHLLVLSVSSKSPVQSKEP